MSSEHASLHSPQRREQLMTELDRLDRAIESVRSGRPSERAQRLLPLETGRARVLDALRRLVYGQNR
jgi:hypothetical protein